MKSLHAIFNNHSYSFWIIILFFSISLSVILYFPILPLIQDDTIYFNAARQFSETQTLYGNSIINYNYSRFGEFNWYGPGYHLVYGCISLVFGFHDGKTSLIFHWLIWLVAILLIRKQFPESANGITISLLTSPFFCFPITFYPIILNSTIAIFGFLFAIKQYRNNSKLRSSSMVFFIMTVVFGTFLRITHIFNFALSYALVKSKKNFYIITVSFLILIGLTWIFQTLFCAPMYIKGDDIVNQLITKKTLIFSAIVLQNIYNNLIEYFSVIDAAGLQISLSIFAVIFSPLFICKKRFSEIKNLYFGIIALNLTLVLVLLGLYSPKPIYLNKQIIILFPLNIIFLFVYIAKSKFSRRTIIVSNLLFVPITISDTYKTIFDMQHAQDLRTTSNLIQGLNSFLTSKATTKNSEIVNILVDVKSFKMLNEAEYSTFMYSLPLSNSIGQNLRYIFVIPSVSSTNPIEDNKSHFYLSLQEKKNESKLKLFERKDALFLYQVLH